MNVQRASWITENRTGRLGRTSHMATTRGVKGNTSTHPDRQRARSLINDNHCITILQGTLLAGSPSIPRQTMNFVNLNVNCQWQNQWQNLQEKILEILSLPTCPVREFMSLIGLLTATEKQVHIGRLHT